MSIVAKLCLAPLASAALLVAGCGQDERWNATDITGVMPDLEFSLVGDDGAPVTADEFRGSVTLLFFGFTSCPDACPATLAQLGAALRALGPTDPPVEVLLVTVDPHRDTPQALRRYAASFGPWLHGATGDESALEALRRNYRISALRLPEQAQGRYEIDHTTAVIAFDCEGHARLLITRPQDTAELTQDLRRLVNQCVI